MREIGKGSNLAFFSFLQKVIYLSDGGVGEEQSAGSLLRWPHGQEPYLHLTLGLPSTAFPGSLAGSCIESVTAGTRTTAQT